MAFAVGALLWPRVHRRASDWLVVVTAGLLPDSDLLIPSAVMRFAPSWHHRGAMHSISMAVLAGAIFARCLSRRPTLQGSFLWLWFLFALATLLHGLVDTLTTYGPGVSLLWPFSLTEVKAPWLPLGAVDLSLFSGRAAKVAATILNEMMVVWAPASVIAWLGLLRRGRMNTC